MRLAAICPVNNVENRTHRLLGVGAKDVAYLLNLDIGLPKLVMTFHYLNDRRELPFEETARLIDNQQSISAMLDGWRDPDSVSADMLESLIGDDEEENPDFFLEVFVYGGAPLTTKTAAFVPKAAVFVIFLARSNFSPAQKIRL